MTSVCTTSQVAAGTENTIPPDQAPTGNVRIESLGTFSAVTTFIAGFALADLGGFDYESFNYPLGEIYVVLMALSASVLAFNAIVGVLVIVAYQRMLSWHGQHKGQGNAPDCERITGYELDQTTEMYHTHWVKMIDHRFSPLGFAMLCFQWAIGSYLVAVCLWCVSGSSLFVQVAVPVVITPWALAIVYYDHQAMMLVTE